jgi:hypothetical protein
MRPGKHDLHFLVGVELLPHAFVNIPDEKMHIGVYSNFNDLGKLTFENGDIIPDVEMEFIKPSDDVKIEQKIIPFPRDGYSRTVFINKMINSGIMRIFIKSNERQSHSPEMDILVQYPSTK